WHSSLTGNDKTCARSGNLEVVDKYSSVSSSMIQNQSISIELGQINLAHEEKDIGAMFVSENAALQDPWESQAPENKEHKEAEQEFKVTTEELQEKLKGNENKQPQYVDQRKEQRKEYTYSLIPILLPFWMERMGLNIDHGKLESKKNSELITSELKQRLVNLLTLDHLSRGRLCENSKRSTKLKDIPSNMTNNIPHFEKNNATGVSAPMVIRTLLDQKDPSLQNVFSSHYSDSSEYACQPSSQFYLSEDKLCHENDDNSNIDKENFHIDTENKNSRDPKIVTVKMKDNKEMKPLVPAEKHNVSAVTDAYKSVEPDFENVNSSPYLDRTSELSLKKALQQDIPEFKNEKGMFQVEFLAVKKETVHRTVEVEGERKKHESNSIQASENLYDGATDDNDNDIEGSLQQQAKNNHSIIPNCDVNRHNQPAKKISNEKNKVKLKMHSMGDLDDLTGSSEIAPEDCELPHSDYNHFMLLIEQLGKDCKISVSLMKILSAFASQERLIKLKKNHCEQIAIKMEKVESKIDVLQKEVSKAEERRSELEHQKVVLEHELCTVRLTLKEEKKRRSPDI
uniref:Uncharacterized protein n=1 Tax=Otolemur garnettii TaxID=30611 RepID=H0XIE7_OTOGA